MTNSITQVPINIGPKPRVIRIDDNGLLGAVMFGILLFVFIARIRYSGEKL